MTRLLAALLIFSLTIPSLARAQTDSEQVAEAVANAAADAAAKELGYRAGSELIDLGFQSTPPPAGESSVGTETVAWVRLGFAVKDYFDAETDKGRAFAAADVAVAALTIAFPPAGAVAAVAVLAVKIIDGKLSHDHAKKMMEIAKRIQAHYEAILVIYRQRAMSDFLAFNDWHSRMLREQKAIQELQRKVSESCQGLIQGKLVPEELDTCRRASVEIFPRVLNFLELADRIVGFRSDHISLDRYFEKHGQDLAKLRSDIALAKANLIETQRQAQAIYAAVGKIAAEAAIIRAIRDRNVSPVAELRSQCFRSATRLARALNLALLPGKDELARRARLAGLYSEATLTFDTACTELVLNERDPLLSQLIVYRQTVSEAEEALFGEAQ